MYTNLVNAANPIGYDAAGNPIYQQPQPTVAPQLQVGMVTPEGYRFDGYDQQGKEVWSQLAPVNQNTPNYGGYMPQVNFGQQPAGYPMDYTAGNPQYTPVTYDPGTEPAPTSGGRYDDVEVKTHATPATAVPVTVNNEPLPEVVPEKLIPAPGHKFPSFVPNGEVVKERDGKYYTYSVTKASALSDGVVDEIILQDLSTILATDSQGAELQASVDRLDDEVEAMKGKTGVTELRTKLEDAKAALESYELNNSITAIPNAGYTLLEDGKTIHSSNARKLVNSIASQTGWNGETISFLGLHTSEFFTVGDKDLFKHLLIAGTSKKVRTIAEMALFIVEKKAVLNNYDFGMNSETDVDVDYYVLEKIEAMLVKLVNDVMSIVGDVGYKIDTVEDIPELRNIIDSSNDNANEVAALRKINKYLHLLGKQMLANERSLEEATDDLTIASLYKLGITVFTTDTSIVEEIKYLGSDKCYVKAYSPSIEELLKSVKNKHKEADTLPIYILTPRYSAEVLTDATGTGVIKKLSI